MSQRPRVSQGAAPPSRYSCHSPAASASHSPAPLQQLSLKVKQQDPLFGAQVCKNFGSQWFHGHVVDIEVDVRSGQPAYFVEYDDGDAEHMTESGVRAHLWRLRNAGGNQVRNLNANVSCAPWVVTVVLVSAAVWFAGHYFFSTTAQEASSFDSDPISFPSMAQTTPHYHAAEIGLRLPTLSASPSYIQDSLERHHAPSPVPASRFQDSQISPHPIAPIRQEPERLATSMQRPVMPDLHHASDVHHVTSEFPSAISMQTIGSGGFQTDTIHLGDAPIEWMPEDADLDFTLAMVAVLALSMAVGCCVAQTGEKCTPAVANGVAPSPHRVEPSPSGEAASTSSMACQKPMPQAGESAASVATPARSSAAARTPMPRTASGVPTQAPEAAGRRAKLVSPRDFQYSKGLAEIRAMGIEDSADVREALTYCQGQVPDALQELFGH